jgi:ubiquinone/menaquinone biosynthesis C-methylase UbiE
MTINKILGILIILIGLLALVAAFITPLVFAIFEIEGGLSDNQYYVQAAIGGFLMLIGYMFYQGQTIAEFNFRGMGFKMASTPTPVPEPVKRELEPELLQQRQHFSSHLRAELPGQSAPEFHVLEERMAFEVTPCSDPMTPMYMLDSNYRIIDWNCAFSACFDRTMEGRRGLNVLEWTYFLENYEDVLDHGVKAFSDADNLPRIDVEPIRYISRTYGLINGIKRAYQIPHDDGSCQGWLITIDPEFESLAIAQKYQSDLFSILHLGLMWSEYALSYDIVLNRTNIYPHLIKTVVGDTHPAPPPIPHHTKVLDLGAGTGNITALLTDPLANRLIVALENNTLMLNVLRSKCKPYLRQDAQGAGVIAIKQDITSLYGLKDNFFDVILINNVLYSLASNSVEQCLKEAYRVLSDGGEIRISEPHKNANVTKVMNEIKKDLKANGHFDEVIEQYRKVEEINQLSLSKMLNKWTIEDMENLLMKVGFSRISFKMDKTYARQSFIICAQK